MFPETLTGRATPSATTRTIARPLASPTAIAPKRDASRINATRTHWSFTCQFRQRCDQDYDGRRYDRCSLVFGEGRSYHADAVFERGRQRLNDAFASRVKRNGPPQRIRSIDEEQVDRLSQKLPASYIAFLLEFGFGTYFDGLYRMADPKDFYPILSMILKGDKDLSHKDCHVLAHNAFGFLWIWSERHGVIEIDTPSQMVFSYSLARTDFREQMQLDDRTRNLDKEIVSVLPRDKDDADYSDVNDEPMFDACVEAYGTPSVDECFGFFPALAFAGVFSEKRHVGSIKRVDAMTHYAFLAQLGTFYLTKLGPGGYEAVRPIG